MKLIISAFLSIILVSALGTYTAQAQEISIPEWIKSTAGYWANNEINDDEFFNLIQFLIDREIITIPNNQNTEKTNQLELELTQLKKQTVKDIQNAYDDGYADGLNERSMETPGNTTSEPMEDPTPEPIETTEDNYNITLSTNKKTYNTSDEIIIFGNVYGVVNEAPILISAFNDNNEMIDIYQTVIVGGKYSTSFYANTESGWNQSGVYTIRANYVGLESEISVNFEYTDNN